VECLENLRQNMRRIRLNHGLTQQRVADLAGVEYKYLQNIEAGRWPNLTLVTLEKIADALKVKPWELLCPMPTPTREMNQPVRKRGVRRKNSK
jgi:transcriptional regulator with XRE-family HTH domain